MMGGVLCQELSLVNTRCYALHAAARMIISHYRGILAFMSSIRR